MRVFVTEINKDDLIKYSKIFDIDLQISFLDDENFPQDYDGDCEIENPYYIEENISDVDKLLSLCEDVDFGNTPIRKQIDWNKFCRFWKLVANIKKQRELGFAATDVEYIYKKLKDLGLNVELKRASEDLGFSPDVNYFVITGKSEIGTMTFYQDDGDFLEFIFVLEYETVKLFTKRKVTKTTHWHPRSFKTAIEDMIAFMQGDKKYFKKMGLNIK